MSAAADHPELQKARAAVTNATAAVESAIALTI
jgi:hypothetical protein